VAVTVPPTRTPHQAIYRRWRAQTFAEIIGQQPVVETLRNAVRLGRVSHGLLFVGPRGTGKTSMARIVAKAVNCLNPVDGEPDDTCEPCVAIRDGRALDVVELDAASNNRVDDMRDLLPRVYTAPSDLARKVFIIDEVQRIKEGWDVLLKTLEEPPDDVFFIFCTTDPSQIRPAVISRLQRYTFKPLPEPQILAKLRRIVEAEGRSVSDDALQLIAQRAAGGMRDAESMLDQVLSSGAEVIDIEAVRDLLGLADEATVDRFISALAGGDPLDGVRTLDEVEAEGRDLVAFADQVVSRLRQRLVTALESGTSAAASAAALSHAARRLAGLDVNRTGAGGYRLQLELCLLEAADLPAPVATDQPSPRPTPPPVAAKASAAPAAPNAPTAPSEPAATSGHEARPAPRPPQPVVATPPPRAERPATSPPGGARPATTDKVAVVERAPADGDALERLLAAWPDVVAYVSRNPANRPLIAACRPIELRDGVIVLGFPESQAFLRDIAERKRSVLEEAVAAVLGQSIGIRCVATNIELAAPTMDGETDLVAQARRIFADDLAEVGEVE
jgi:DNA polymerase-3 subunit gamma/tau